MCSEWFFFYKNCELIYILLQNFCDRWCQSYWFDAIEYEFTENDFYKTEQLEDFFGSKISLDRSTRR